MSQSSERVKTQTIIEAGRGKLKKKRAESRAEAIKKVGAVCCVLCLCVAMTHQKFKKSHSRHDIYMHKTQI
jgi:hypothetical protein